MRNKNERSRTNNERTSNGNGRNREQGKRVGTEPATIGQVRSGSTEVHPDIRQISLFRTADIRDPIREDIGTRGTSSNDVEDNNSSTGEAREGRRHRGFHGESGSPATDQAGSRQHSYEGNSVKSDVKIIQFTSDNEGYGKPTLCLLCGSIRFTPLVRRT